MKRRLILKRRARSQIKQASVWYQKNARLGRQFLDEIEKAINLITEHPFWFQCVHRDIRRAVTKRFRYLIFFILEPKDSVTVIAVLHGKQDRSKLDDLLG